MRRSAQLLGMFQGLSLGKTKNEFFTSLWNKPETKDERVKEYVPEVLEESLMEQKAVLEENSSRDTIVELGHKILQQIDNKSPTPSIAPLMNQLLIEYGAKDVIAQRPLSYLLYPSSSTMSGGETPHELVVGFPDHFRRLVEEVELAGCSIRHQAESTVGGAEEKDGAAGADVFQPTGTEESAPPSQDAAAEGEPPASKDADTSTLSPVSTSSSQMEKKTSSASEARSGAVVMAAKDEHEAMDITMFVKVASGMAMANLHCGDLRNAVRCVDAALAHAVDAQRVGGLLGLKAGLLVRQKRYDEAISCAQLAVEASGNVQGYLHGAYALRKLGRPEEVVALLEQAKDDHPMNTVIDVQLEAARKEIKLSLPEPTSTAEAVAEVEEH